MRRSTSNLLVGLLLFASFGCGSDDDEGSRQSARVTDIQVDDSSLRTGEGTVVRTDFTFDHDSIFDYGTNIVVVVKIGDGLRYRDNTAEIQGGNDKSVGAQITRCIDGSTFLVFDMDHFDLDGASDPGGYDSARLSLTVDAVRPIGNTAVGSRADYDESIFSCGDTFYADEVAGLTIN